MSVEPNDLDTHELTPRQVRFCTLLWCGLNQTRAYLKAYGYDHTLHHDECPHYGSAANHATKLLKRDDIQSVLTQMARGEFASGGLTRDEKRHVLRTIVHGDRPGDALRAIEIDNKMTGDNAPEQFDQHVTGEMSVIDLLKDAQKAPNAR